MHIVVHDHLEQIDARLWNRLVPDKNPFLMHEFLNGLEITKCVCPETGWQPQHIAVYSADKSTLIAAMPCYIKDNSYGEYIFDWAWVNAYHRHGIEYYPKLSNAVPFTPATGNRLLMAADIADYGVDREQITKRVLEHVISMAQSMGLSSFHSLFNTQQEATLFEQHGLLKRHSSQFHWQNQHYANFDDFLAKLSSKKRKNIKRERRRINEAEISYQWLNAEQLTPEAAQTMYGFYARTISYYGAQSYLNRDFFDHISKHFSEQTLFLFASHEQKIIAGGLYFKSLDTLYGRYWGALNHFHSVHFETCYYQAIEWCIKHQYARFEAGAQGEHKLARGLEPVTTYSSHWISHPEFRSAIQEFLDAEENHIEHYQTALKAHSPFKKAEI